MSTPTAGWYPDPTGLPVSRWWNGVGWSEHTQPAPAGQPQPSPGASPGQQWAPAGAFPAGQAFPPGPSYPVWGPAQPAYAPPAAPVGWLARNTYTLVTLAVVAIYVAVAFVVHVVFFGFLPIVFAARAVRSREPLMVVAILAAAGALVFAVTELA